MAKAIGMKLFKPQWEYSPDCSKFFGPPAIPAWMESQIAADEVFLAQIKLSDIADLDTENVLPHEGWLYFFIKTEDASAWSPKQAVVRYSKDRPAVIIDDFNEASPVPEGMNKTWLVDFAPVEAEAPGLKLLGVPCDWNYADPAPMLLMQYDPLESPAPFLSEMDGFAYIFADEDRAQFSDAFWSAEYS